MDVRDVAAVTGKGYGSGVRAGNRALMGLLLLSLGGLAREGQALGEDEE